MLTDRGLMNLSGNAMIRERFSTYLAAPCHRKLFSGVLTKSKTCLTGRAMFVLEMNVIQIPRKNPALRRDDHKSTFVNTNVADPESLPTRNVSSIQRRARGNTGSG